MSRLRQRGHFHPSRRAVYKLWYSLVGTVLEIAQESESASEPTSEPLDVTHQGPRDSFSQASSAGALRTKRWFGALDAAHCNTKQKA